MRPTVHPPLLISVVIPTRHRNADLAQCLGRLAPGRQIGAHVVGNDAGTTNRGDPSGRSDVSFEYEVIVTDDGVTTTAEALVRERFPWARWLAGPKRGPAANRNHGVKQARGDWVAFTDDDCLPEPAWLASYAAAIVGGQGERVLEGATMSLGEKPHPFARCPVNQTGGRMWSCNVAIERRTFERLGGFDEQFPFWCEDMEFSLRVAKSGTKVRFVPAAAVYHPWTTPDFLALRRSQVRSLLQLARLHPEQRSWISLRGHCRRVLRFYLVEFFQGLSRHGWMQVRCLPAILWDQLWSGWMFARHGGSRGEPAPVATRLQKQT